MLLLLAWVVSLSAVGQAAPASNNGLCPEIVSTFYPQWTAKLQTERLRRIEVRNCRVEDWGFLQIAAWEEDASRPTLIVDTCRTTIVKAAMARDVFVLETAGVSSNVVQVVTYENGKPRLALDDAIKAYAGVDITWKKVVVVLSDGRDSERIYEFPTGI